MTLLQRELNIMIHQQQPQVTTPTPKKRKGKFKKRLLKKESSTSSNSMISGPSVPADGVKGKTWGPSSAAPTKQRPNIVDQNRWKTTSAPSLEKPLRPLGSHPTVNTVLEVRIIPQKTAN